MHYSRKIWKKKSSQETNDLWFCKYATDQRVKIACFGCLQYKTRKSWKVHYDITIKRDEYTYLRVKYTFTVGVIICNPCESRIKKMSTDERSDLLIFLAHYTLIIISYLNYFIIHLYTYILYTRKVLRS